LTNPASDPFVIAVGAAQGPKDKAVAASYSSEGSQDRYVDLVAPGRSIVSLRDPGSYSDQVNGQGRAGDRFVRGSGTSQAAAVVSGAVALLLEQRPQLKPDEVKALLKATATSISGADPALVGVGLLNIKAALGHGTIYTQQRWTPSTGTGSLEAARGNSHVTMVDGTALTGEQDVFGNLYSADAWTTDAWATDSWTGARWSGARWSGARWSGARWSSEAFSGARWSGARWSGARWSGARWSGARWSNGTWT
jgi:serine protease AprX